MTLSGAVGLSDGVLASVLVGGYGQWVGREFGARQQFPFDQACELFTADPSVDVGESFDLEVDPAF